MESILTDLSRAALAASIPANLHAYFGLFASRQEQPLAGILRWETDLQHPWFNGVLVDRPPEPRDEQLAQDLRAYFQTRGARHWSWWVGQPGRPGDWAGLLKQAGMWLEHDTPGMALPLERLSAADPAVPGLEIQPVASRDELETWSEVFVRGYGLPLDWARPYAGMLAGIGLDWPARNYLGLLEGKPVASASLFLGAGVAGIYNVATLPEARRRGIGTAMTVAPLLEARQKGYRAGILQSSQAGYPVYHQLGFEQYCEVEVFLGETGA